jgi:hypothetical protein
MIIRGEGQLQQVWGDKGRRSLGGCQSRDEEIAGPTTEFSFSRHADPWKPVVEEIKLEPIKRIVRHYPSREGKYCADICR